MNWKSKDLSIMNVIRNLKERVNAKKLYRHVIRLEGLNVVNLLNSSLSTPKLCFDILDNSSTQYTKETLLTYGAYCIPNIIISMVVMVIIARFYSVFLNPEEKEAVKEEASEVVEQ